MVRSRIIKNYGYQNWVKIILSFSITKTHYEFDVVALIICSTKLATIELCSSENYNEMRIMFD